MCYSPSRQAYHAYSNRCGQILEKLFARLKTTFPSAVVIVKRGVYSAQCVVVCVRVFVCIYICMYV